MTDTGLAAHICALGSAITDDPVVLYNPVDDTITIAGADGDDYGTSGDVVFDSLICVLGGSARRST